MIMVDSSEGIYCPRLFNFSPMSITELTEGSASVARITPVQVQTVFTTSNHFKGMLDDVRIFHVALTETEVQLLYNSEKP